MGGLEYDGSGMCWSALPCPLQGSAGKGCLQMRVSAMQESSGIADVCAGVQRCHDEGVLRCRAHAAPVP